MVYGRTDLLCVDGCEDFLSLMEPEHDSYNALLSAIDACLAGLHSSLVTGPISKAQWIANGHHYHGQTELLAERCGCPAEMLFCTYSAEASRRWRVALLTRHIPLVHVIPSLTFDRLSSLVQCLIRTLQCEPGQIALAALNPHAGEDGNIGTEELFLRDWCRRLCISGPHSTEHLWYNAAMNYTDGRTQEFAVSIALYHDQVLPLLKSVTRLRAVNVSIGLPFRRTSPDHGTADHLVGTGLADSEPFMEAVRVAVHGI